MIEGNLYRLSYGIWGMLFEIEAFPLVYVLVNGGMAQSGFSEC